MSSVNLSASGPGETVLNADPKELLEGVRHVDGLDHNQRRDAAAALCARFPMSSRAWATLGDVARDDIEAYSAYRVGYHRGLDALRAQGWRGSGYVRWEHESNRGFLRCLDGLATMAGRIGETAEAVRCSQFSLQLDPQRESRESR